MNTNLTRTKRVRIPYQITLVGAALLLTFGVAQSASAEGGLVVKLYPCPRGQAAVTADTLRDEYGVIPGVRVAADPRTSQVIVQAPPEVQTRISQRLAAAFPELQPAVEARHVPLQRIQADQLEASLKNTLGDRLSAIPEKRPASHGYRLALASGGTITIWIDSATKQVNLEGPAAGVDAATRLIQVLDSPTDSAGRNFRVLALQPTEMASVQRAAALLRTANGPPPVTLPVAALLMQQRPDAPPAGGAAPIPAPPAPAAKADVSPAPSGKADGSPAASAFRPGERTADFGNLPRIVNPVQMEVIEGLGVVILRGSTQDVEQMMRVVEWIDMITKETEPEIQIEPMKHLDSGAMVTLLRALYDEVYAPRQGAVSITALAIPNAILIVGRPQNVKSVIDLIALLDKPAIPGAEFQMFHLKYANAVTAQTTVQNAFTFQNPGLAPAVRVTAEPRTNSLIVQASPRDMAAVADLISKIDVSGVPDGGAVNDVRIVQLKHTRAQDIATIINAAIGQAAGAGQALGAQGQQQLPGGQQAGGLPGGQFGQPGQNIPGMPGGQQGAQANQRTAALRFLTLDAKGRRLLRSGILTDVRITADAAANALVISSPPDNLDLLEGLVRELDNLPAAEAQIKVFTIVNGDAQSLSEMLRTLFTGQPSTTGGQQGGAFLQMMMQSAVSGSENSLVPLRFGVDTRTNSVIVSGAGGDLNVVEAILTKLDDSEVRKRRSVVIRLKNSPATDVQTTISTFVNTERQALQQAGQGLTSAFELMDREVVIVAEPVTNSLVLSATPKYFDEIRGIIEQLDARPPMVMIQVLIASVELGSTNEFGIELGLQDAILFDRSILSNLQTTTTTTAAGVATQTVVSANAAPGFNFNNGGDLGNPGSLPASSGVTSNSNPNLIGGQAISNFATGRTNNTLGYSGLVLSAASENVSALLRALSENHRVDVLQRPQVMTLDNQPAFIQVGQRVPRITSVTTALTGTTNGTTLDNVGLILGVTPRISPDGLVVMQIDAEKSELESETTGIPIFTSPSGQVVRSPIIDATTAQTTVAAMSGQTVVLGGLLTTQKSKEHHGVPVLEDIPVINWFFHYDSTVEAKSELLIIMTPHIVRNQADADAIKRAEAAKMTWCLCDVTKMYGEAGLRRRTDEWTDGEVPVIYPDNGQVPASSQPAAPEAIPSPSGQPSTPMLNTPPLPNSQPSGPATPATGTPAAPRPAAPDAPSISDPATTDPSASIYRYPATQQAQYGAPPQWPAAGVQPTGYQPQPWQQGNAAQPAVYQAPLTNQPNYQQPQPPYQPNPPAYYPPAYYPPNQGAPQR